MLSQKYWQTISSVDPGKIYIENIRSAYNVSRFTARLLCEMAVSEKLFIKQIGVICPICNRIIEDYDDYNQIPEFINCFICEAEENQCNFSSKQLKKEEFYKLVK